MKHSISEGRREFLALLGASSSGLVSFRSNAQPRHLTLTCSFYPGIQADGAQLFADRIAQVPGGTIEVSIEPGMPMPLEITARRSALALYCAPCVAHSESLLGLSAVPMLTATFDETATLHRIAKPYYSAALARHGQVLLAHQPWLPGALWSNFPIRSVADLKGAPFAVVGTPGATQTEANWGRPFAKLGARSGSFSEAQVIIASSYSGHLLKLTQEFAYFSEIFFATHISFLAASQEVFDTLSETEQQILRASGHDTELAMWRRMTEQLLRRQQEIAARGVKVLAQPPGALSAALREAAEPDIQAWARSVGADGSTILANYRRAIVHG